MILNAWMLRMTADDALGVNRDTVTNVWGHVGFRAVSGFILNYRVYYRGEGADEIQS